MIYGLLSNKSCKLSEISRALKEKIPLKKVIERVRRNLFHINFNKFIEKYHSIIKPLIDKDCLISVDLGDIVKDYAKNMENLEYVRDGNKKCIKKGYNLIQAVAVNSVKQVIPLTLNLFSVSEKQFKSLNYVVIKCIEDLSYLLGKQTGIYILDRGNDSIRILEKLAELKVNFIMRMNLNRDVFLLNNKKINIKELVKKIKYDFLNKHLIKLSTKSQKRYLTVMGTEKIKLKGINDIFYLTVLRKVRSKDPEMILLTTKPINNSEEAFDIMSKYLRRWGVEDAFRYIKQCYDYEDIRVRKYKSLQNMTKCIFLTFGFLCIIIQKSANISKVINFIIKKAEILFEKTPTFLYYALSNGISKILFLNKYLIFKPQKKKRKIRFCQLVLPLSLAEF